MASQRGRSDGTSYSATRCDAALCAWRLWRLPDPSARQGLYPSL